MKLIFTTVALGLIMGSCQALKNDKHATEKLEGLSNVLVTSSCPKRTECTVELLTNTSIDFATEKSTGKLYVKLEEDSLVDVVKYHLNKLTDKNIADAGYREEIYFEVPKGTKVMDIQDKDLADIKAVFGRFCFCKDAGYFKIENGHFRMNEGTILVDFKIDGVSQQTTSISFSYTQGS